MKGAHGILHRNSVPYSALRPAWNFTTIRKGGGQRYPTLALIHTNIDVRKERTTLKTVPIRITLRRD